jgi:RAQPRD family integrative conjugative element protein
MFLQKIRSISSWIMIAGLVLASSMSQSNADEVEAAQLASIVTEINYLIKRIDMIENASKGLPKQRLTFRYQDLISDLKVVKGGISDFIEANIRDGRMIEPLDGRYR